MAGAQLLTIPRGSGVPETSATRPPTGFDEGLPKFSERYTEVEYLLAGTAKCYDGPAIGPPTVVSDGHRYATRVLARYPKNPADFSGRVLIEPFNTTLAIDRDALWMHVGGLLQRQGDAWIGITDRALSATELRRYDAQRYADVEIPTNDIAWDLLRAIGTVVKEGGADSPLHHLPVRHVYLGGYSQSGVDTATFAAAFGALTRTSDGRPAYDGFFPACHAASLAALAMGGEGLPRFEYAALPPAGVPVIEVQPQSDVEGFSVEGFTNPGSATVRREDSEADGDRFRLYEIAGAPHAAKILGCDGSSSYPMAAFVRVALRHLFRWAEDGVAPPKAPRIALSIDDVVSEAAVDRLGNPIGGVPSPFLDVPITRYAAHSTPGPLCKLAGREMPFPHEVLADRYGDVQSYLAEFTASLDATIRAGFLLEDDRAELLEAQTAMAHEAFARSSEVPA